jgi:hypothetical protein
MTYSLLAGSSDPNSPAYASPAYREMEPRWQLVDDVKEGTGAIRRRKETYLPKFEAETPKDWDTRVNMTFVTDYYATTIEEHVGLVFAEPMKLGDDVPAQIRALAEDIDGEGNHLDVFAATVLSKAFHYGHVVLYTDKPDASNLQNKAEERRAQVRPYVQMYPAPDVLRWRTATVGGVKVIVQIALKESETEPDGIFGSRACVRIREFSQVVFYDEFTGRATGLGGITWKAWKQAAPGEKEDPAAPLGGYTATGEGPIIGPKQIPARVVYGGEKLGVLWTRPHAYRLAEATIEHTQLKSDYRTGIHKTNVATPIFIGRNTVSTDQAGQTVQMGQGIDIPIGGDAKFLETTGAAIGGTRQALIDMQDDMRRQGATIDDATGKVMTAKEAGIYAKQRNAKIVRAARSLQDALEGVFADMAAFMTIDGGGSLAINQDYAGQGIDPAYLTVLVSAYQAGALPLDALLYALEKGKLPEDFQEQESALRLIAEEMQRKDQATLEAEANAAAPDAVATVPPKVAA